MNVGELMTAPAVTASRNDTVQAAAERFAGSDIGAMPVCDESGKLLGMVTDRDLVIRCIAAGKNPAETAVDEVMTRDPVAVNVGMDAMLAAHLMGRKQIRRLPVMEDGKLCGMLSLGDIAEAESIDAGEALAKIKGEENFFWK